MNDALPELVISLSKLSGVSSTAVPETPTIAASRAMRDSMAPSLQGAHAERERLRTPADDGLGLAREVWTQPRR